MPFLTSGICSPPPQPAITAKLMRLLTPRHQHGIVSAIAWITAGSGVKVRTKAAAGATPNLLAKDLARATELYSRDAAIEEEMLAALTRWETLSGD